MGAVGCNTPSRLPRACPLCSAAAGALRNAVVMAANEQAAKAGTSLSKYYDGTKGLTPMLRAVALLTDASGNGNLDHIVSIVHTLWDADPLRAIVASASTSPIAIAMRLAFYVLVSLTALLRPPGQRGVRVAGVKRAAPGAGGPAASADDAAAVAGGGAAGGGAAPEMPRVRIQLGRAPGALLPSEGGRQGDGKYEESAIDAALREVCVTYPESKFALVFSSRALGADVAAPAALPLKQGEFLEKMAQVRFFSVPLGGCDYWHST